MPSPNPMECSDSGCDYSTPVGIPTFELLIKALELHVKTAHTVSSSSQDKIKAERPKRPTVKLGLNESDWEFFVHEWERYTRQTGLTGTVLVDELWSCMETELRQSAFNERSICTIA